MSLPADEALAAQIEQRLARHAEVMRPPPQALSLETIELIAAIATTGASIATVTAAHATIQQSRAETLKALLEIKQLLQQQGQAHKARISTPATGTRTFADADDAFLTQLLSPSGRVKALAFRRRLQHARRGPMVHWDA